MPQRSYALAINQNITRLSFCVSPHTQALAATCSSHPSRARLLLHESRCTKALRGSERALPFNRRATLRAILSARSSGVRTTQRARWSELQTVCYHCYRSRLLYVQSYVPMSALSSVSSVSYCRSITSPARAAITRPPLLTVSVRAVNRDGRDIDSTSQVEKRYGHEVGRIR